MFQPEDMPVITQNWNSGHPLLRRRQSWNEGRNKGHDLHVIDVCELVFVTSEQVNWVYSFGTYRRFTQLG